MNKVKVALVGFGHLGKWHAEKINLLQESELTYIVESFKENAQIASKKYPKTLVVDSISKVQDVDAFVIVTPTSTHYEILKDLSRKPVHIFCEKPLCSKSLESKDILENMTYPNNVFMTGHSERCHQIFEKHNLLGGNQNDMFFKRVTSFKGRASDVDVLQDLCIHDIDLVTYLLKENVKSLETHELSISVTDFYDRADFSLIMESGRKVRILADRNFTEEERSIAISGIGKIDLMNCSFSLSSETGTYEKRDHLLIEHQSFYNAILNKSEPLTSFQDGHRALEILDAVYESYKLKKSIPFSKG